MCDLIIPAAHCPEHVFCFNTANDRPHATHLLVYMAQSLKRVSGGRLDFVSCKALGGFESRDLSSEDEDGLVPPHSFVLGDGLHTVWFEDSRLMVDVGSGQSNVFVYKFFGNPPPNKQVTIRGLQDTAQMGRLLQNASNHVGRLLREEGPKSISRYVFEPKGRNLVHLGRIKPRSRASLFLGAGESDRIFKAVGDFIDAKGDYERCSVPYKLNVLLHGLPGTGKTSIITAVAAEFKLSMAIIPFSPSLTDDGLAFAFSQARQFGCRVVALEDVDCLFEEGRKPHDTARTGLTLSGLLNCMDGLLRGCADGMIMFLTANVTNQIDAAVLRTSRIDLAMEFSFADEGQTRACYDFYRGIYGWDNEEWAPFWDGIGCFQFTTAVLQQYFFSRRAQRGGILGVEEFKTLVRASGKDGTLKPIGAALYS
jgi:hypothetical protein